MDPLYQAVSDYVAKLKAKIVEKKSDGKFSFWDGCVVFFFAVRELVAAASGLDMAGADKKAAVVAAALRFYDDILAPIDIPWVPAILEATVVDPLVRAAIPDMVEALYQAFKLLTK